MAFDSSPGGTSSRRSSQPNIPLAPRPDPASWTSLREEGVKWEGQVLLVGSGIDVPALLVLTDSRLVLFSNGEAALDLPRTWLRPEPKLLTNDQVRLSITPLGSNVRESDTDRITLRIRGGRNDAARLISAATGRVISPREEHRITRTESPASWSQSVGAATPMALPPLPDFDDDPVIARATRQWPPVGINPVPEAVKSAAMPDSSVATWVSQNLEPETPASPATHQNWPVQPVPSADRSSRHRGAIWGLRSLILAVLVGTAVYFGYDRLPENFSFQLPAAVEQRFGLDEDDQPTDVSQVPTGTGQQTGSNPGTQEPVATENTSDGTNGAGNQNVIPQDDENGVGGIDGELTPVDPGIGTYADGEDETPAPDPATEAPVVVQPTEEPAAEPTVSEPAATESPATEEPATEAPATEAPVTPEPATEVPATEAPATQEPATEQPVTPEPTQEIPVTESPAEEPTTEPTLESQPPSVNPDEAPAQEVVNGGFRYTLTGLSRGETIAELPDLAAVPTGEWIVLTMSGQNWTDTNQVFDISQFRLYADGQEVLLDVGNAWISGLLGQTPAYGNTDAIMWAPQEGHEFALTFLAPRGTESLTLVAGDQVLDLSAGASAPISPASGAPEATSWIDARVVGVVDAETVVIEIDGIRQTVRYLGLDVPTGDDCYASEATEANRALVEGQTVRIERQATDTDARGNWVRDVWAPTGDGSYALVAESLVANGAATAGVNEPNTRFAAWLTGSQAAAQNEGLGMWGACEMDLGANTAETNAIDQTTRAIKPQTSQRTLS